MRAALKNDTATVAELVRLGADMDIQDPVRLRVRRRVAPPGCPSLLRVGTAQAGRVAPQSGETALMRAASRGLTGTVAELARSGADINAKDIVRCALCKRARAAH